MIRLTKSSTPPTNLTTTTLNRRIGYLKSRMTRAPHNYTSGAQTLPLDPFRNNYGHQNVRDLLESDQHHKCCYCESKWFGATSHENVEHFRPKGSTRQDEFTPQTNTGYYWLICAWENLYLSCHLCNTRHKSTYFPLMTPSNRAITHHDPLTREDPILIDPYNEDPSIFLEWEYEHVRGIDTAGRGKLSREVYGLWRDKLVMARAERLADLGLMLDQLDKQVRDQQMARAIDTLAVIRERYCDPSSSYSAMCSTHVDNHVQRLDTGYL